MQEELTAMKRREAILQSLRQNGQVSVRELTEQFLVSDMTIRRDLHRLEEQGLLTTHYGGASLRIQNTNMVDFHDRKDRLYNDKLAIARTASGFIQNNDIIYLDTSSTILMMLPYLPDLTFTVVTNSLPVMSELHTHANIRLAMAPGIYDQQYGGCADYSTIDYLRRYHYNKAFFGASAVDSTFGASATREIESAIKTTVFHNSEYAYLLVDHSKFGKKNMIRYNEVTDYTQIFTDSNLDERQQAAMIRSGAHLYLCS